MEDNEVLREVIQLYENYRVLWDSKHSKYYNKSKRGDAWRKISTKVDIPVKDLKKKVTSLLGSYRRERLREKKSLDSASGPDDVYKSKWFAYTWFQFLHDKADVQNDAGTIDNDVTLDLSQEIPDNAYGEDTEELTPAQSGELTTIRERTSTSAAQRSKKRRVSIDDKSNILHSANPILNKTSQVQTSDHYDSFGIYVATELRKYDNLTLPYVKKAILDVLFRADIGEFS